MYHIYKTHIHSSSSVDVLSKSSQAIINRKSPGWSASSHQFIVASTCKRTNAGPSVINRHRYRVNDLQHQPPQWWKGMLIQSVGTVDCTGRCYSIKSRLISHCCTLVHRSHESRWEKVKYYQRDLKRTAHLSFCVCFFLCFRPIKLQNVM